MHKLVWLSEDESQCMHASSYLPRFPKPVSHTNGRSLAPAWHITSAGYSLRLTLVQNSVLSVKCPLSFSACLSQSLQRSLCCNVFPALELPVCGSWWSGVECGEGVGGGRPKRGCSIVSTHSIHPPLICRSLGHLGGEWAKAKDAEELELWMHSRHTCTRSYWTDATLGAY